jgi:hypothetical protein
MTELDRLLSLVVVGACGFALLSFLGWQRQQKPVSAESSRDFALRLDPHLLPMQPIPLYSAN